VEEASAEDEERDDRDEGDHRGDDRPTQVGPRRQGALVLVSASVVAVLVLVGRPPGHLGWYLSVPAVATLVAVGWRMVLALREARGAAEAYRLARTDDLTELPNRRAVLLRLDEGIAGGGPLALMLLDLDGFKEINDTLGHAAGDAMLELAATRMCRTLSDEVLVARLGGDEFALVLPVDDPLELVETAERVRAVLAAPARLDGLEVAVDASVGIAVRDSHDSTSTDLLRRADVAMYQAKRNRHLHVYFYSEEMNARALERLELGSEIRHAVEREEFEVYYQPKVEVASGRIAGVEGLLRWRSPTRGLVPPATFIPILEDAGLIAAVGRMVLARACKQANEWCSLGFGRIQVAVNVSPAQFKNDALVEDVQMALEASGLSAGDLQLEITESLLFEDFDQARSLLEKLAAKGISIALDDFGTGYSSLGSLHNLPVNCVKIDQSFVHALGNAKSTIVAVIINVAHTLGMKVVAEGVETEAQRAILESLGCEELQGYLVALPMRNEEFLVWLNAHRKPHLVSVQAQKKE
jgi:diguanylate cyclase (GGDEF)-like protein